MKNKVIKYIGLVTIIIALLAVMLTGCVGAPNSDLGKNAEFYNGINCDSAYSTLQEISVNYPDRTSGSNGAKAAVEWIASELSSLGYIGEIEIYKYKNPFNGKSETGYNAVYTKKGSSSDKKVIIGASYDNVTNIAINGMVYGGDGTYNNATGIVALIETAKALQNVILPYDVDFVAFGSEEVGGFGSEDYIKNMTDEDKENTLLMINFDRAAGGDYVYMYSSEAETKHNKYFYDQVDKYSLGIAPLPYDLGNKMMTVQGSKLPYYHEAMLSDNLYFGAAGIPYVNFISLNFSEKVNGTVLERKGEKNIAYTSDDEFETFERRLGGQVKATEIVNGQIANIVSAVCYSLTGNDFVSVIEDTSVNAGLDGMMNGDLMYIITYSVLGGLIVLFLVLYYALRAKTRSHKVYIDTVYGRVDLETRQVVTDTSSKASNPNEDIFGLGGEDRQDKDTDSHVDSKPDSETDIFGEF